MPGLATKQAQAFRQLLKEAAIISYFCIGQVRGLFKHRFNFLYSHRGYRIAIHIIKLWRSANILGEKTNRLYTFN
jgi:hypothetical protein